MGKINLTVEQGATFTKTIGYYSGAEVVASIAAVVLGYPTLITVPGHGLPEGSHPVWFTGAKPWLNSKSLKQADMMFATWVDADTVSLRLDSTGLAAVSSGSMAYVPPFSTMGYTARMEIRKTLPSTEVLLTLTTDAELVLGEGTVSITIGADVTAALDFTHAVYDLELVAGALDDVNAVVTRLFYGTVTLSKEVTR